MTRFLTICVCFLAASSFAQINNGVPAASRQKTNASLNNQAETIQNNGLNSPSVDVKSQDYYRSEADNFEEQAKQTPTSAQAWLNLYKSSLFSYYNGSVKILTAQQKQDLNEIVAEMKTKVPGSFEYNIAVYINGQHNTTLLPYLARAEEMKPADLDVVEQMVAYQAITGNDTKLREYIDKHEKLVKYETFIDEYAYNLLMSVEDNAILFTHGIMDTYPLYYQQYVKKAGKSVEIINIDYLASEEYRKNIGKKLGITITAGANNYVTAFDIADKLKASRGIYFSNAFAKTELKKHAAELELSGLAMKYGSARTSLTILEARWKTFKTGSIEKASMRDDYSRKMSANYQPVLLALYKYYSDAGLKKQAEEMKNTALKIARVNGTEKQVTALLH